MDAGHEIENYLFTVVLAVFALLLVTEKWCPYQKLASASLKQSFSTNTSAFFFLLVAGFHVRCLQNVIKKRNWGRWQVDAAILLKCDALNVAFVVARMCGIGRGCANHEKLFGG